MIRIVAMAVLCAMLLWASSGCNSVTTEPNTPISQQNLRAVGDAYGEMVREKNRPPANLEELKPYLKKRGDPDALIKSENDGEPFVIYFGVNISATGKEVPVIAHEKSGRGGKRLVLQGSTVRHMTEEEFQAAPFPPGKKAP